MLLLLKPQRGISDSKFVVDYTKTKRVASHAMKTIRHMQIYIQVNLDMTDHCTTDFFI